MATSVNQVIKETIQTIKERGLVLTPDNYAEVFCETAKKNGVIVPDCQKLEKYVGRLNDEFKAQLKQKNVKSVDELFAFMASRLNSPSLVEYPKLVAALCAMSKKVLQAAAALHNKSARKLAEASIEALNRRTDAQTADRIKDKWFDFLTDYDDSFLKRLNDYGIKKTDDLAEMVVELDGAIRSAGSAGACEEFVSLLTSTLEPSITDKIIGDIDRITKNLKDEPRLLESLKFRNDIKNLTKKRIELDKAEISSKIAALDKVLEGIDGRILRLIDSSKDGSDKMGFIRRDLGLINLSKDSFEGIRDKMLGIADMLDGEIRQLGEQMMSDQLTIKELQEKISALETQLEDAKAQSREDFLTKTATRKAFVEELERFENEYLKNGLDYCVCFFDIDHFKKINDAYGHDAGDTVIASVAKTLLKASRKEDIVSRYGGEEFVVLLPGLSLEQSVEFASRVRTTLKNSKFLYKEERISVTISCGVAVRSAYQSSAAALEASDKMLYEAKQNGRDQVMPKI